MQNPPLSLSALVALWEDKNPSASVVVAYGDATPKTQRGRRNQQQGNGNSEEKFDEKFFLPVRPVWLMALI
jgi:hypothetical protein